MKTKAKIFLTTLAVFLTFSLIAQKAIVTDFAYIVAKKDEVDISSFPFFLTDAQRETLRNIVVDEVKKVVKVSEVSFTQGNSAPIDFYDKEGGNVKGVKVFGQKSKSTNVSFYESTNYKEVDKSTADYFVKVEMWMNSQITTMPKENEYQLKIDVEIKNNQEKKSKVFKNNIKNRFFVLPTADYIMSPRYISAENNFSLVKDALPLAFKKKAKIDKKEFTRERDTKYDEFLNASSARRIIFRQEEITVNEGGKKGKVIEKYDLKFPKNVLRRAKYVGTEVEVSQVNVNHKNSKEKFQVFTINYPNSQANELRLVKSKYLDKPTEIEIVSKDDKNPIVFVQTNKEQGEADAKIVVEGTVDNKKVKVEISTKDMYLYVDGKVMGIALLFQKVRKGGNKQYNEFAYFLHKDVEASPAISKAFINLISTKANIIAPIASGGGGMKFGVGM